MRIVVASGKGGVGKSMFSSSLSVLFSKTKKVVAIDCDVDAPNLGLWLGVTQPDTKHKISTSTKASINLDVCKRCGKCIDVCRFNAIPDSFVVNHFFCEGCGACQLVCPTNAISLDPVNNGEIRRARTRFGFELVYGQVYPGETGSGKVVSEIRKLADGLNSDLQILDAAAGIGCPVIASIQNTDFAILITEPSVSGLADIQRALEIIQHFNVPYGVVINQWDINPRMTAKIEEWAGDKLLGKLSYDKRVVDSIVNLKPVILSDSKIADEIRRVFERVNERLLLLNNKG